MGERYIAASVCIILYIKKVCI